MSTEKIECPEGKKRILIFSLTYLPYVGGAELAIKEETDRIHDINFDMITLRFDKSLPKFERLGNINIHRIGFCGRDVDSSDLIKFPLKINKYLFPFLAFFKARALHQKNSYDAIWTMMANYASFGALFFKMANKKIPYLLTLQEGDPLEYYRKRIGVLFKLFKQVFVKADFVQVISNYLGQYARDMGFKGEPVLIPNAVDVAHFSQEYSIVELNQLKKELGKKEDSKFIITTSRLVTKNSVDDVINAFEFLPKNIKFLILGTGPDEADLRELVRKKNIDDQIIFLGYVEHALIPKYLKISDIFIRPSKSEGFGSSFVEAMASGVPVIATPVGGIVDFLFDPKKNQDKKSTGIFCEVNNPKNIAQKIEMLINDSVLSDRIVENAREMVREKYDWNIISHDMANLFKKIIN